MISLLLIVARLTALLLGLLWLVGLVSSSSPTTTIDADPHQSSKHRNVLMMASRHAIRAFESASSQQQPVAFFPVRKEEEPQQQQQNDESSTLHCEVVHIYLTQADISAHQFLENNGIPAPGVRFGGSIPARTSSSASTRNDESSDKSTLDAVTYNYLLTFLSASDCLATGAYTFAAAAAAASSDDASTTRDQITFTATCNALPYFTITGGQGRYAHATGHVQYQIPLAEDGGYRHEIHVCTTPNQSTTTSAWTRNI